MSTLKFSVSTKGGVSVYGLQKFPVTLYKEQWLALLDARVVEDLLTFMQIHDAELKMKGGV